MKHWKETAEILAHAARIREAGGRSALATVVRIKGSAYRRPGAKFLVEEGGQTAGSVSGGCLEADVREAALGVLRGGECRLLHYETGSDDRTVWGLGLGCNGSVDIFVQPAIAEAAPDLAGRIRELLEGETAFAISTVVRSGGSLGRVVVKGSEGVLAGSTGDADLDREIVRQAAELLGRRESRLCAAGSAEVFIEVLAPPPHLLLFGAGDDAIPLCSYAADAGFRVTVVDHRAALLVPERFPGAFRLIEQRPESGTDRLPLGPRAYAVVKTHAFAHDREWTRVLLAAGVPYVGMLGPHARSREILRQIGAEESDRVFAPVGLDLGAEGPEQIAVSIVAEILAACSAREPWSLREKEGAIHAS